MFLNIQQIAAAIEAPWRGPDVALTGVSTDSRAITSGTLFVALRGERYDGHKFAEHAVAYGASALVVDTPIPGCENLSFVVPDTLIAYGKIAHAWRQRFTLPIVAVTGSVGKTTMKEMIALTLSPLGPVLKSEKNENNEVGLPLTLLRLSSEHRSGVVEMGMRGFGQIKYLAEIALPTIAVLTVIGESHIEMVGSRDGIAQAKAELLEQLKDSDTAVLNLDDPYYPFLLSKTAGKVITYGATPGSDVRLISAKADSGGWDVSIGVLDELVTVRLESPARHDALNACGACAAAIAAGVLASDAARALELYRTIDMRMQVLKSRSGATVISDCYNAAPSSVISALRTLAEYPSPGKKIAFLGDMRELGEFAAGFHKDVADAAAALKIDTVFPVGSVMPAAFSDGTQSFATSSDAAKFVQSDLRLPTDSVVLVKGSRALELETVVRALVEL